ncbi:mannose-6-phosphate isomerase, class I [Microbacterium protaetiae]|uniref:mannose-6-phosphate isomerase n=1 Tax=Microbacterium protaetiae TaxID=2509458 RepID=A0A4P6ED07_9MICO|nr:mannose-6-phosphate isomerase, class I [Microbacterium protaetiae]QAY60125.1 mannose-6-phosphate isomerase, class I [Microbacterium protaetiae]
MAALIPLTNTPRDYAWGAIDGVARTLGWAPTGAPEAELWLGSHPLSPSRSSGDASWPDLAAWETQSGTALPYLLKLLSAASPLSLQAHPTPAQAAEGFAREQAAGIPLTARERNYKDPNAKPELIVAVDDGFEALCGFRPVDETVALIDALAAASDSPAALQPWRDAASAGVREGFVWLLSGAPEVDAAVAAATAAAHAHPAEFELIDRLAREYPADPGILVAQTLNHVTLAAGESLWLPAGNIHAYLRGTGVELMGPSDNVLRGGLTPKHIDRDELQKVLDFTPGPASRLAPVTVSPHVVSYRPTSVPTGAGVGFELLLATGDATLTTGSAAIVLAVEGSFTLSSGGADAAADRGAIVFVDAPGQVRVTGAGRLFVATGV